MGKPNPGAVASLADVAARILNSCSPTDTDSCAQPMAKLRAALLVDLQATLRDVYPDPRDHNPNLRQALVRRISAMWGIL